MKNSRFFFSVNFPFLVVRFSIYFNRRDFVMWSVFIYVIMGIGNHMFQCEKTYLMTCVQPAKTQISLCIPRRLTKAFQFRR